MGDREERVAASQGGRESDGDMVRFSDEKQRQQKRSICVSLFFNIKQPERWLCANQNHSKETDFESSKNKNPGLL